MRFAIVGEGLTDYVVLKNLLIGFFSNKDLPITRLLPKDREPVGWGNVLKYLTTTEFRDGVEYTEYTIIQIDTKECEDWNEGIKLVDDKDEKIDDFIEKIKTILINKIGLEFYESNISKIFFAISVHEIECWLLPFNTDNKAHQRKLVGCFNAIENIANKHGFSLNQKNYEAGKHYDILSKGIKSNRELKSKNVLNPSLKVFIESLKSVLPNSSTSK